MSFNLCDLPFGLAPCGPVPLPFAVALPYDELGRYNRNGPFGLIDRPAGSIRDDQFDASEDPGKLEMTLNSFYTVMFDVDRPEHFEGIGICLEKQRGRMCRVRACPNAHSWAEWIVRGVKMFGEDIELRKCEGRCFDYSCCLLHYDLGTVHFDAHKQLFTVKLSQPELRSLRMSRDSFSSDAAELVGAPAESVNQADPERPEEDFLPVGLLSIADDELVMVRELSTRTEHSDS